MISSSESQHWETEEMKVAKEFYIYLQYLKYSAETGTNIGLFEDSWYFFLAGLSKQQDLE